MGAGQWINRTLVKHLHQNSGLQLVGLPKLQYTHLLGSVVTVLLGNNSVTTQQVLDQLRIAHWGMNECVELCPVINWGRSQVVFISPHVLLCSIRFTALTVDFTQLHRESGLFACVSVRLVWTPTQRVTSSLFIHPLLIPSSLSGLDLHVLLTVTIAAIWKLWYWHLLWGKNSFNHNLFWFCSADLSSFLCCPHDVQGVEVHVYWASDESPWRQTLVPAAPRLIVPVNKCPPALLSLWGHVLFLHSNKHPEDLFITQRLHNDDHYTMWNILSLLKCFILQ